MKKIKLNFIPYIDFANKDKRRKMEMWREHLKKWVNSNFGKSYKERALNYDIYILSMMQWVKFAAAGLAFEGLVIYTFYHSLRIFLWTCPLCIIFPIYQKYKLAEKRKQILQCEFKEAILLLASSLQAGYAIENAILASGRELMLIFGEDCLMAKEFAYMGQQIHMNRTIEEVMMEFGKRSGLDDIKSFAKVLAIAKRSGGELVPIIHHTAEVIRDKIQVEEEIVTITASKQLEQKIMNIIPFLIIVYLNVTSPGFFDLMYETLMGRVMMSIFLSIYATACWISYRILRIEV